MTNDQRLKPASELARHNRRYPGESAEYRDARTALLAEEIELRRHIERVAAQRRTLRPGGEVSEDYRFEGADGPVKLSELFGPHSTLVTYNFMFGPERERPCPSCTATLGPIDAQMPDLEQRIAFVAIARSPVERLTAFARERHWRHLRLVSSAKNTFNRDYFGTIDGDDMPIANVFERKDGAIRHRYATELIFLEPDPGQDPRHFESDPLWYILDLTPEGRGTDWYPKLEYGR
jgi:predicted dithiol-disulfide oxidoreductase (DUF899 family)